MDASNIILLIKEINPKYNFDVLTIHHCFGVQANIVDILSPIVIERFITLYGDRVCIK